MKSSSCLIESSFKYEATNLGSIKPDTPWVEGVPGDGIGEKITLSWQTWKEADGSDGGIGCLIFSNGYISYDKPYLFEKNNRVKEIEIKDISGKFNFIAEIEDTPDLQLIFLPYVSDKLEIKILSVYKGTTYDDTCINFISGLEMKQAEQLQSLNSSGDK